MVAPFPKKQAASYMQFFGRVNGVYGVTRPAAKSATDCLAVALMGLRYVSVMPPKWEQEPLPFQPVDDGGEQVNGWSNLSFHDGRGAQLNLLLEYLFAVFLGEKNNALTGGRGTVA